MQLDEAKGSNQDAHLIFYVRFVDGNKGVGELLCKRTTAGRKAQDLFEILDTFMAENNLE